MNITGNTILITGGSSGIGRGLAEALHRLGNRIVIVGRRQAALDEVVKQNPGIVAFALDIDDPARISEFKARLEAEVPDLNMLVNNAGIQRPENLSDPGDNLDNMEAMIATNLLGPMRLTAALLPLLRKQSKPAILNVTSGLAFVPLAGVATYCATKAAMHSYTTSLRYALRGSVEVIEIVPPYVQTNLGQGHGIDPRAMPLKDFIEEVVAILQNEPNAEEVVVERCKPLRNAPASGTFKATFEGLNRVMASSSSS